MARGIADLATRLTMDSSQATASAGKFSSRIAEIGPVATRALKRGLSQDIGNVIRGFDQAADKTVFLTQQISGMSTALAAAGPVGLVAGLGIQAGLALGVKSVEQMRQEWRDLSSEAQASILEITDAASGPIANLHENIVALEATDLISPTILSDLEGMRLSVAQSLNAFGLGAGAPVLSGFAAAFKANEGDIRQAASDVVGVILDEAQFSNDLQALTNAGLDTIVSSFSTFTPEAAAAASALAADMTTAFDIEDLLEAALRTVKPVLGANNRGVVIEDWRSLGAASRAAYIAGLGDLSKAAAQGFRRSALLGGPQGFE